MAVTLDIGDVAHIKCVFTQIDVPLDPSTVSCTVKVPSGTSTTYTLSGGTVTRESTGNYYVDLPVSAKGTYRVRWFSTGSGQGAEESWFQVRAQQVP